MNYVISDIHGCYNEYLKALEMIGFSEKDNLYILGDCIDRGYASVKVVEHMMSRSNIIPLAGNHELMALPILKKLSEATDFEGSLDYSQEYLNWCRNGGDKMFKEFIELTTDKQRKIVEYIADMSLYEELTVNSKSYLLIHAGLEPFVKGKEIDDYTIYQLLWSRADYNRTYFENVFTVTGHTPTVIEEGNNGTIIRRNNHIAIDCGCVYGYNLAVFCLDTEEEFYIKAKDNYNRV